MDERDDAARTERHGSPALQPRDPRYGHVVRASFEAQGLLRALGARLVDVAPGRVVIELDFGLHLTQQQGMFHGGAIGAIGDSAAGYAALSLMPPESEVVTVEYKINFARPARGSRLIAHGEVVRAGRTLTVARAQVDVVDGGTREPCAFIQATMYRVDLAKEQ
jgi:uncharacterized protein (TIGR00369 family)